LDLDHISFLGCLAGADDLRVRRVDGVKGEGKRTSSLNLRPLIVTSKPSAAGAAAAGAAAPPTLKP